MKFTNCHPELVEGVLIINTIELRQAQFDKQNLLFRKPLLILVEKSGFEPPTS